MTTARRATLAVLTERGGRPNRASRNVRTDELITFVVALRKRDPMAKYADVHKQLRERFKISKLSADAVLREAGEVMRADFEEFCRDAPRFIFDAYAEIHREATRDRDWGNARGALDSMRDMFGIRGAIHVNVSHDVSSTAFAALTDEQVRALAQLDIPANSTVFDVPSASDSVELATLASNLVEEDEP